MKHHKYWVILIILFTIACAEQKKEKAACVEKIDISEGFKRKDKIYLSQIASDIKYIPLETRDECLIGRIHKIVFQNNLLFIEDEKTSTLFLFRNDGKFIRKIGSKGKGPGEYISISDFTVIPKDTLIFLYDGEQQRLIKFRSDGSYIQQFFMEHGPEKLTSYNDTSLVLAYPRPDFAYNNSQSLLFCTNSLNMISRLFDRGYEKITPEKAYYMTRTSNVRLEYFNDSLTYWEYLYDTVYRVVNINKVFPRYAITYNFKMPVNTKDINEGLQHYALMGNYLETKDYIFCLDVISNNTCYQIMYKKNTHEILNIYFDHPDFMDGGFYNDIDGGWPFLPKGIANDGFIYDTFNPASLAKCINEKPFNNMKITNTEKRKELNKILESSNTNTNPLIMLLKLK